MGRAVILCGALSILAAAVPAAANDSLYTDLDLDRCRILEQVEEGESVSWECPGQAGIPLFVSSGDGRFDIDAGVPNDEWETLPPFNNPGPRVEWRVDGPGSQAIIFRLVSADPERPGSALFVATVGRAGAPGCTVAVIDGSLRNANRRARQIADRRAGAFRCGTDVAERLPAR
ncbi:MAG TPA: hypothetical protein VF704_04625 [Allosphingosinicella sp.]|jgi:hypothetical protein